METGRASGLSEELEISPSKSTVSEEVKAKCSSEDEMQSSLQKLEGRFKRDADIDEARKHVCFVSGEVLKWMAGRRPGNKEKYNLFSTPNGYIIHAANLLDYQDPAAFSAFASAIVEGRNDVSDIRSLADLELEIESALRAIELFPSLKKSFKNECRVLLRYQVVKKQVPSLFG